MTYFLLRGEIGRPSRGAAAALRLPAALRAAAFRATAAAARALPGLVADVGPREALGGEYLLAALHEARDAGAAERAAALRRPPRQDLLEGAHGARVPQQLLLQVLEGHPRRGGAGGRGDNGDPRRMVEVREQRADARARKEQQLPAQLGARDARDARLVVGDGGAHAQRDVRPPVDGRLVVVVRHHRDGLLGQLVANVLDGDLGGKLRERRQLLSRQLAREVDRLELREQRVLVLPPPPLRLLRLRRRKRAAPVRPRQLHRRKPPGRARGAADGAARRGDRAARGVEDGVDEGALLLWRVGAEPRHLLTQAARDPLLRRRRLHLLLVAPRGSRAVELVVRVHRGRVRLVEVGLLQVGARD